MNRPALLTVPRAVLAVLGVITAMAVPLAIPAGAASTAATGQSTYIVLYHEGASSSDAGSTVEAAGGTVVANYAQIGVVVARSADAGFAAAVQRDARVEGVSATRGFGTKVADVGSDAGAAAVAQAAWGDSLSSRQWDMRQIRVPEAHQVSTGSRSVLVGDIDTGLDFTHVDLASNYDAANSADCTSGAPQPLAVGNDAHGHGTHTAGTIAAAANGIGIVGVAPNVRIAGIRAGNADGFFFAEAVVCSFIWAGTHGIDVTNNSYFADPWLFNCKNDPGQRAIWNAERRAIRFAQSQGVLVVAAEGNESTDLSHPEVDVLSPDDTTPVTRDVTNACAVVPVEVPGVVGVTATGALRLKSFYSSYGISTTDVAAPGGDTILQVTPESAPGRVLSTWPAASMATCLPARRVVDASGATYCLQQGTSMASPHVVGVAALILSAHGPMTQGALAAKVQQATNPLPCPDTSIYADFPQSSGEPQTCQGGTAHNSFYGAGEVDALKAVQ